MMHSTLRRRLSFVGIISALLVLSCEVGDEPIGPEQDELTTTTTMPVSIDSIPEARGAGLEIVVDAASIAASFTETEPVAVLAFDPTTNTPLAGQLVYFATSRGLIDESVVTDTGGQGVVTYRSAPYNEDVVISAWTEIGGETVAVKRTIALTGVQLSLATQSGQALLNQTVATYASLRDASGSAISGADITVNVDGETTTLNTPGSGDVSFTVSATTEKEVVVVVNARGARDTAEIAFLQKLPVGGIDSLDAIRSMRLYASKSQLRADNTDYAIITAILATENNNPAVGDTVFFEVDDYGIIDAFSVVDSSGRASAILRASPVNGLCHVRAYAPISGDSATTTVSISGVSLELVPQFTELKAGEFTTVDAYLKDASGNAVDGDEVTFTVSGGQFEDGTRSATASCDQSGHAAIRLTSNSAGTATLGAESQNTADSVTVRFTLNTLSFVGSAGDIAAGGQDSVRMEVSYVNGSGTPIENATIHFATSAGLIRPTSVRTDANGHASTWLLSAQFAGAGIVQATAAAGYAIDTVGFYATGARTVSLAVTPDNIGTQGGIATLIATVRDKNGNLVSGVDVNFKIEKGPGGGEQISSTVATTQAGVAQSTLVAGSVPSMYRAVEVSATVGDSVDTSKLTISGPPHIISVARPESDTVDVPGAGLRDESTFEYYVGAVVQDINGNPVADGTEVHFSAFVSGMAVHAKRFVRWSGEGSASEEIKAIIEYALIDIPFEDINNNFRMDPAVDLRLDDNDAVASRGDDWDGDGDVDYAPAANDFFWDFNLNGVCDTGVGAAGEPYYEASKRIDYVRTVDTTVGGSDTTVYDTVYTYEIWADLNDNGVWDRREWVDYNHNGVNELPAPAFTSSYAYDFDHWRWERLPVYGFRGFKFEFDHNEFAVVIASSATTVNGVAQARLTYPRQFARRLYVTVNSEANGIQDKDGERFALPILR